MADAHVEEHWPELAAYIDGLAAIPSVVTTTQQVTGGRSFDEAEIDRIHEGLLRKQRGGSLGLNE